MEVRAKIEVIWSLYIKKHLNRKKTVVIRNKTVKEIKVLF